MSKSRAIGYLVCLGLLFGVFGGVGVDSVAQAAKGNSNGIPLLSPGQEDEEPAFVPKIELSSQFPNLEAISGNPFEFEVEFSYVGREARTFDLTVDTPQNWISIMKPRYEETQISAIRLKEFQSLPEKIKMIVVPLPWDLPEPGEYTMTLTATSGEVSGSIELIAVVTAKYNLEYYTESGRLNTKATAGKENHVALKLRNSGTATIDKVTLSSSKPEGWTITFTPENVENLEAGFAQDIDVVIEPPGKAIAGDYSISLKANSKEIRDNLELRVTLVTPTIWGWVGIGIVLLVIAGLALLFRQLGRR